MSVMEQAREIDDNIRLAAAIRAGDHDAFLTIFRSYYERLCRYVYRYVESRPAAEDLVAEVFLRVWVHRERWDPGGNVRAYLFTSARNRALDHLRRLDTERRALRLVTHQRRTTGWDDAADQAATRDLSAILQRAIDELPPRPRQVVLLRWQRQLSNPEIAEELGIALKTVEMHVTRAYDALRQRLPNMR
jgi:RNA polymerase sigma-70 factor (ECF subfamily)